MRVLIAGVDGFIGWPLALELAAHGKEVMGIDSGLRRDLVRKVGGRSVIPIPRVEERVAIARDAGIEYMRGDITSGPNVEAWFEDFAPDTVVQLAEQPSAAFSMATQGTCVFTQCQNLEGTLNLMWAIKRKMPGAHLVKLGSMGEYGTPEFLIPEAPPSSMPRSPGSFYHASKVHGSTNLELACRVWGELIRCTDVMQGVVYGNWFPELEHEPEEHATRCDVDECFGTVIHRFCAQAVAGHPLTVYGAGGQTRGFLPLRESLECLERIIDHPPAPGQYRTVNQLAEVASVLELAELVQKEAAELFGATCPIDHIDNPRIELEEHTYEVVTDALAAMGYEAGWHMAADVRRLLEAMAPHRGRINVPSLSPEIQWCGDELRKGVPLQ